MSKTKTVTYNKELNRWIDKNNNSWDADIWDEKDAARLSGTLINCSYCSDCSDCSYCSYCRSCSDCSYCSDCRSCSYCSKYKENPNRYVGREMGREDRQTYVYWVKDNIQVICGCFRGDLEEFKEAVKETHGDNDHGKNYNNLIKIVETIRSME